MIIDLSFKSTFTSLSKAGFLCVSAHLLITTIIVSCSPTDLNYLFVLNCIVSFHNSAHKEEHLQKEESAELYYTSTVNLVFTQNNLKKRLFFSWESGYKHCSLKSPLLPLCITGVSGHLVDFYIIYTYAYMYIWQSKKTSPQCDKYLAKKNDPLQFKTSEYPFKALTLSLSIHHTLLTLGCISYISEAPLRQKIITCVKSTVECTADNEALAWPQDMIGGRKELKRLFPLFVAVCPKHHSFRKLWNFDVTVQKRNEV